MVRVPSRRGNAASLMLNLRESLGNQDSECRFKIAGGYMTKKAQNVLQAKQINMAVEFFNTAGTSTSISDKLKAHIVENDEWATLLTFSSIIETITKATYIQLLSETTDELESRSVLINKTLNSVTHNYTNYDNALNIIVDWLKDIQDRIDELPYIQEKETEAIRIFLSVWPKYKDMRVARNKAVHASWVYRTEPLHKISEESIGSIGELLRVCTGILSGLVVAMCLQRNEKGHLQAMDEMRFREQMEAINYEED